MIDFKTLLLIDACLKCGAPSACFSCCCRVAASTQERVKDFNDFFVRRTRCRNLQSFETYSLHLPGHFFTRELRGIALLDWRSLSQTRKAHTSIISTASTRRRAWWYGRASHPSLRPCRSRSTEPQPNPFRTPDADRSARGGWSQQRFAIFPEFRKNRSRRRLHPLVDSGKCWHARYLPLHPLGWQPRDFSFLLNLSVPIGALLAPPRPAEPEGEVEKLTRQLATGNLSNAPKA